MEALREMTQFLDIKARLDLKAIALQHILSVTGTAEGRELLRDIPEILGQFIILTQDASTSVAKDATLSLVNVSADEAGAKALLLISESSKKAFDDSQTENLVHVCIRFIMDKNCPLADSCCMILSNMTRPTSLVNRIVPLIEQTGFSWESIVTAFTANRYNTVGATLHYLGPVFSNLSQSADVRSQKIYCTNIDRGLNYGHKISGPFSLYRITFRFLMDKESRLIQRLLPFTEYTESIVRRGGIIGTIKNCCFDTDNHTWLLSPQIDLLPHLLLPLAGPEEFDDEDNNKLPLDLQYLPETKKRETDPDIRIMILEALGQLCATREGREFLRDKNTYVILREFHKWEKDNNVILACENVVDIVIRTEDEIGLDNIKEIEVPSDYTEKFKKMDDDFVKGN